MLKKLSFLISLMVLTACSSISDFDIIEEITAPDYVSSSRARKLEIPPDLSQIDTAYFSVQKCFGLPAGMGIWIV